MGRQSNRRSGGHSGSSNGFKCDAPTFITIIFILQVLSVSYFFLSSSSSKPSTTPKHHHDGLMSVNSPSDINRGHQFMIVGILSDRNSAERRAAVRDTWLKLYKPGFGKYHILHKFVVGMPYCIMQNFECDKQTLQLEDALEEEELQYRDILRVNVLENYNTLSEKVCALIEWAALQSFDYFLKTDHDIFIRLDTLVSELGSRGPQDNYWSGFAWHDVPPISDRNDKNRELLYELGKFPPYTAGALHILSANLVRSLSSALPRRYYQNEDQSLGIWLLPFKVTPIHDKRIQQWDVCDSTLIAKHPLTPQRMRDMYNNVVNGRDLCDGFATKRCPLCFDCRPDQDHWTDSGLTCDDRGASVGASLMAPKEVPKPVDDVMSGVLGYLPLVHCKQTELEGPEQKNNYVKNGHFETKIYDEWIMKGSANLVKTGMKDFKEDTATTCIQLMPSHSRASLSYISQTIDLGQKTAEPLVFSAWSKAEGVDATKFPEDYALYANVIYNDGSHFVGFTISFEPGTHDWQYNVRVFNPERPIAKIEIFCVFRFHTGTVWFDNIAISKLSDGKCKIKFHSQFLKGVMPSIAHHAQKEDDINPPLKFIVIWTTSQDTFRLRHRRVIESIFFHHPDAHVKMYSNTLPDHFFHIFNTAGYNIEIVRYDLEALSVGLPGQVWVSKIPEWEKGEAFFAHQADYLRFVLLFREGGVYTDMDSILVRPIEETNVIGVEKCDEEKLDYCIHLSQFDKNERYYLPIGFLVLSPSHPLMYSALSYFDTRYDPNLWPCGTIYLTLAYTSLVLAPRSVTDNRGIVRILPREAFYPVPWQQVKPYFTKNDAALWERIKSDSYAFHIWGQMTEKLKAEKGSLIYRLLNEYTITNRDTIYEEF